ncbi:MAG TPA: zinc ribbon domain-containing protein [Candidatus Bilamarchaeum sp.]|nr:zinc ribbon domain-containing protein [Candidatus Bilamarchaeum sp.]
MDLKKCDSCGMPMTKTSDFGGMKKDNRYCKYCTYDNGQLKPRHEIHENMVQFYMKAKKLERKAAEQYVDEIMARSPAWQ